MTGNFLDDIKLIVFDVDGVLTDGTIAIDNNNVETKKFYVRDGTAIRMAQRHGIKIGVLTGRTSLATTHRMRELDVELVIQGSKDKGADIEILASRAKVSLTQTAYLGDDVIDIPAMRRCGFSMAVADAVLEVQQIADFTTGASGGRGAAREAIEYILKAQNKWEKVF